MKTKLLLLALLFPCLTFAQTTFPNRGGTGTTTIPQYGQVLMGDGTGIYVPTATSSLGISGGGGGGGTPGGGNGQLQFNNAGSFGGTSSPNVGFITATRTDATSTLPRLSITTALNFLGDSITNVTTWFQGKIDAYLTGGQGVTYSAGGISFDCSEVEGTGIDCSGENVTLDATGAWTGTFDGQEGTAYLARANHTGTQLASTISDLVAVIQSLSVGTTSALTIGQVPFVTGPRTVASRATTTLTAGTGIALSGTPIIIGSTPISISATGDGGLASSSPFTIGNLNYVTSNGTIGSVATGTLSASGGLTVTAGRGVVGGSAAISPDTGFSVPSTTLITSASSFFANPSSLCVSITGAAGLCDGLDDTAAGGSGLSTTTPWTIGQLARVASNGTVTSIATSSLALQSSAIVDFASAVQAISVGTTSAGTPGNLAFWTGGRTLGNVATGTISASGGISVTAGRGALGGALAIAPDTGFTMPTTTGLQSLYANSHSAVTLAGQNYLSLSGQQITATSVAPTNLASLDFGSFTCNGTTCTVDSAAISNAMLANSTVSYGGVSLSLGGSDATPAFNLADATGLPISTGVSGLGTGIATWLATPSSANLDTAVTDDTGSGALVFGTSPSITSPTLSTFFGTPCTGNEFLQDISDTGAFTCVAAAGGGSGGLASSTGFTTGGVAFATGPGTLSTRATTTLVAGSGISFSGGTPVVLGSSPITIESTGGGGGGSLSTSTDIIGAPGTPESLAYVSDDFLIGGSSSTTAEFRFDPDGGQMFFSSTTNTNATMTIASTDNAQAVRLGTASTTSGLELLFGTVGQVIARGYGAVTEWVFDMGVRFMAQVYDTTGSAGSSGQVLTSTGTSTIWTTPEAGGGGLSFLDYRSYVEFFDDFMDETTNAGDAPWSEDNSGTGAGCTNTAIVGSAWVNRPGLSRCSTGTTATGRAGLVSALNNFVLGNGTTTFETSVFVNNLSNGTNRYQIQAGFFDTNTVNATDGAYLLYDEGGVTSGSTASANWSCVTAANSARTFSTSTIAVSTSVMSTLKVEVNADGSSASFYVNDVLACTHTTNIPGPGFGRATSHGVQFIKSLGLSGSTFDVDYNYARHEFTTAR